MHADARRLRAIVGARGGAIELSVADDALAPGEDELPQAPTDEQVEEMAEKLGAPSAEKDTLPLEGE